MPVRITQDKLKRLLTNVRELTRSRVLIGIPGDAPARQDTKEPPNHVLGFIHEFGMPDLNIPARPFLIPGVRDAQDRLIASSKASAKRACNLSTVSTTIAYSAMVRMGEVGASSVRARIVSGPFQPLAPLTLAIRKSKGRKGEKPLIDTGAMRQSVTYVLDGT